ncbi:MAG: CoA transferase [Burkholderiaceae bacterium]|nr:CoA transferase [Burkholderiaceae bacterium]
MSGPFSGIRIIDLSSVLMGPLATQLLADFGAEVIKVESKDGDMLRGIGPGRHPGMGAMYLNLNRNKQSVALDLQSARGRAVLLKLIEKADVLLFNIRPQSMARLGLSYEEVKVANPSVIYLGAYGFGQDGSYAARPAYDDLIEGATAIPYLSERMTGHPSYVPFSIADHMCGMYAAYCLSAALFHRKSTGQGQSIEVPMFETMAQTVLTHHLHGKTFVPSMGEAGYPRQIARNRKPYATRDGHVCTIIVSDQQWSRAFDIFGRPELKQDIRFKTLKSRTQYTDDLYEILEECLGRRTTQEWVQVFRENDIPVMPMYSLDDLLADQHLREAEFFQQVEHPSEGTLVSMKVPSKWSVSIPDAHRSPAPRLGQHTAGVLSECGYTAAEIQELVDSGVVSLDDQ